MNQRRDTAAFQSARDLARKRRLGAFAATNPTRRAGELVEPDLAPSDPRLERFHLAAVPQLRRFVFREISGSQLAANLRALAQRHGVEQSLDWQQSFSWLAIGEE